jgi:predicted short-subunit dehydrogenase-like oxidoreductase (DUF2520 family)
MGKALAYHLSRKGWRITGIYDIDGKRAKSVAKLIPTGFFENIEQLASRSNILFFAVPDGEIARVAEITGECKKIRARFLFHTSGIQPANVLRLVGMDRVVYSLHPFGGVPEDSIKSNPFKGLFFSGEGDFAAKPLAMRIAKDLEGEFIQIHSGNKTAYHLAATFISNDIFALFSSAERLLRSAGIPENKIKPMLFRIANKAIVNYYELGLRKGLTGPITRGDSLTIAEHLIVAESHDCRALYEAGLDELKKIVGGK